MYTLLDTCLDRLDIFEFLSHVEDGLKDHYDIKVCTAVTFPLYVEPKRNNLDKLRREWGNLRSPLARDPLTPKSDYHLPISSYNISAEWNL